MGKYLLIIFLILPICLFAQRSGHFGAPKYVPSSKKKLLIVGQDLGAVGGLEKYTDGYIDYLEHMPAGVTTYTGFPGLAGLKRKANWGAGDVHADAYTTDTNFDNTTIVVGLHLVGQLGSIIEGNSDYEVKILGNWIREQDRPIFLRIGYEFDGPWNGYDPEQFKDAWKYLVHSFDSMEVRNVAYVWQSAGVNTPNISRWYPGDEYVNWVGYSHFDGPNPGQSMRDFADQHDKPIMIAESTPRRDLKEGSGEVHWRIWYDPLFNSIYENDRIQALAYINADWDSQPLWDGQGWGDSRVQVNEYVEAKWRNEMGKEPWLFSSAELFDILNHDMWKDSVIITSLNVSELQREISIETDNHTLAIRSTSSNLMKGISCFDIEGRLLYKDGSETKIYQIPLKEQLKNQVIVIKILRDDGILSRKIFVKA